MDEVGQSPGCVCTGRECRTGRDARRLRRPWSPAPHPPPQEDGLGGPIQGAAALQVRPSPPARPQPHPLIHVAGPAFTSIGARDQACPQRRRAGRRWGTSGGHGARCPQALQSWGFQGSGRPSRFLSTSKAGWKGLLTVLICPKFTCAPAC